VGIKTVAKGGELKCHGYRVLPEQDLPRDEAGYVERVTGLLNQCQLSVHLVGSLKGGTPVGPSDKAAVVLQNELAIRCGRERGLHRIIWVPDNLTPNNDEQKAFISRLQNDAGAQYGADLITSSERETLKAAMHAALAKIREEQANPRAPSSHSCEKSVYIICDPRDKPKTKPMRQFFSTRDITFEISDFEGDPATVRIAHEGLLKQSDGIVIFYGEAGKDWRLSSESEVRKVRAGLPQIPVWTYLAGPQTADKIERIESEVPRILNSIEGFSEVVMKPFVEALERVNA
jgi:hypothetical protein